MQQTKDKKLRFMRSSDFWQTAFKPLQVRPIIVAVPGAAEDTKMFGLMAEEDIEPLTILVRGTGFRWPSMLPQADLTSVLNDKQKALIS